MSKLVQVTQYEQITIANTNNISKFILEDVLKDFSRYTIANTKNVVFSESANLIEQNTGTDYNVKVNPFFSLDILGNPTIRSSQILKNTSVPSTNPRVDIVQAELAYDDQNQQSRQFIDPITGNISSTLTYTEFALEAEITIKEGTEAGSPVAPTVDSGKIKIGEMLVATSGGIATADIFNVDSKYGTANTGWTTETAITTLLNQTANHIQETILDHPNESVTLEKLAKSLVYNLRSFSTPVAALLPSTEIVLHEITLLAGEIITIFTLGIAIINDTSPIAGVEIEVGTYIGSTFTQLVSTNLRNNNYAASSATYGSDTAIQIRLNNTTGSSQNVTSHFIYTIK